MENYCKYYHIECGDGTCCATKERDKVGCEGKAERCGIVPSPYREKTLPRNGNGSNREKILNKAKANVCGGRDLEYGKPEDNFETIGKLWEVYLKGKYNVPGLFILPKDVAAMMVLFKMGREATGNGKEDNWVDAVGYAACGGAMTMEG